MTFYNGMICYALKNPSMADTVTTFEVNSPKQNVPSNDTLESTFIHTRYTLLKKHKMDALDCNLKFIKKGENKL